MYGSTFLWLAMHLLLWGYLAVKYDLSLPGMLNLWDAANYTKIVRHGYSGNLWAFYPLYPVTVRGISHAVGAANVQIVGALLSTAAFALFTCLVATARSRVEAGAGFAPRTLLGWLFLVFSPSSFLFHSHHTEGLFLLLSYVAIVSSRCRSVLLGGLAAAFCALLRNQGVLVVAASAMVAASAQDDWRRRVRAFAVTGGIGALGVAGFLLFQLVGSGSAWTFAAAQTDWIHADSALAMLRTLYFGNPWQEIDGEILLRYGFFWLMVGGTVILWKEQPALAIYGALSLCLELAQGDFINAFRYGAVIFPVLFKVGDALALRPRWAQGAGLTVLIALNLHTARRYALAAWAY
jgi:hypothetical protein